MAHILAQKQLRSIILSVSLPIPFSSLPLQCLPLSPPLCLCLSLLLFEFQPLLFFSSVTKMTPATSSSVSPPWSLSLVDTFSTPVPFCLFIISLLCEISFSVPFSFICLLPSNPRHSRPNPLIPLCHILSSSGIIHFSPF